MRYIGSKENLLDFIEQVITTSGIRGGWFCDLFAGTTIVGRYFKRRGYHIISNDLMEYSFVFGKAYIENNTIPGFRDLDLLAGDGPQKLFELDTERLEEILDYLNGLPPETGFMFDNYSDEGTKTKEFQRMYFTAANAGKIDVIRNQIDRWKQANMITDTEFYILLAALLEAIPGVSNISGTYGAFLKYWEPRSQKMLTLTVPPLVYGTRTHKVYKEDANKLAREITCDILYLDPPYNSRQYAPNYHILETVARWDYPKISGKSGLRPYEGEKSAYCQKERALQALGDLVCRARCQLLVLSYNSEGIMPHEDICRILGQRGKVVVSERTYRRFRSDKDHAKRQYQANRHIIERIYSVQLSKESL